MTNSNDVQNQSEVPNEINEGTLSPAEEIDSLALEPPPSRARRILKICGWVSFALFCLSLFTFLKLPREKLKAYVDGALANALAEKGMSYTARAFARAPST